MGGNHLLLIHHSENGNLVLKIHNDINILASFTKKLLRFTNCNIQLKTDFVNDCVISNIELHKT